MASTKKMVPNGMDQATLYALVLDLKTQVNLLLAKLDADVGADINALLAKLDADAGITDTDYVATLATAVDYESTLEVDSSDAKIA